MRAKRPARMYVTQRLVVKDEHGDIWDVDDRDSGETYTLYISPDGKRKKRPQRSSGA